MHHERGTRETQHECWATWSGEEVQATIGNVWRGRGVWTQAGIFINISVQSTTAVPLSFVHDVQYCCSSYLHVMHFDTLSLV